MCYLEFPTADKEGAHIADHTTLVDLGNVQRQVGDSILHIKEAVDDYFKDVETHLNQGVDMLQQRLSTAEQRLSIAQQSLSSCLAAQRYDEESRSYRPSCRNEEHTVKEKEKECDRIRRALNSAKRIQSDVNFELSRYQKTRGLINPPGGGPLLEELGNSLTLQSTECLSRILESVEDYIRFDIRSGDQRPVAPDDEGLDGVVYAEHNVSKTEKFNLGIDRLKEMQRNAKAETFRANTEEILKRQADEHFAGASFLQETAPMGIVICNGCHRPVKACACPHERQREHELPLFNYNLVKER